MAYIQRCRRLRKLATIWDNSLLVIAGFGVLFLCLTQVLDMEQFPYVAIIGQLMSIVTFAAVWFFSFMLIISKKAATIFMLAICLGSAGIVFGYLAQMSLNQIYDKPPIIHLAGTMLGAGLISLINKNYEYA